MSEDRTTGGDWEAHVYGGCFYVISREGGMVADDGADEVVVARLRGVERGVTLVEMEANAYVLAASRRMRDALRGLIAVCAPREEMIFGVRFLSCRGCTATAHRRNDAWGELLHDETCSYEAAVVALATCDPEHRR